MIGQKTNAVSRGLTAGQERGRRAELSSLLEKWGLRSDCHVS